MVKLAKEIPLIYILATLREMLRRSQNPGMTVKCAPEELLLFVDRKIDYLLDRGPNPGSLAKLFLPTGDLEEIAIDNGWGDLFERLAEDYARKTGRAKLS